MGFCPFTMCLSRAGLFSVIFLLRQLWLEWPDCCSALFFSYFIKIFSFSPLYLLRLLALYCGLHVFILYRSIFLPFVL